MRTITSGPATPGTESGTFSLERLAHDARGPLGVIRAHTRLLLDGVKGELSEGQRHSLEVIDRQALKMSGLVDQLDDPERIPLPTSAPSDTGGFHAAVEAHPRILVADDDIEMRELLDELLASRYHLSFAQDGAEALAALRGQSFHLAIVDLDLPAVDGFGVATAIRAAGARDAPAFMFLSAHASREIKVRGLALGAADYVTKPFDPEELVARIARIIAGVAREASLRADAMTDSLTGLANYRSFTSSLERELERAGRYQQALSLITLDLDHLKTINDEHGHDAGNEAICLVAEVLVRAVRSFEVVARQGGDEFAVLLPNTAGADAEKLAERLRVQVSALTVRGVGLSASIGVAAREPNDLRDAATLFRESDQALYRAKRAGRGRVESARRTPGRRPG